MKKKILAIFFALSLSVAVFVAFTGCGTINAPIPHPNASVQTQFEAAREYLSEAGFTIGYSGLHSRYGEREGILASFRAVDRINANEDINHESNTNSPYAVVIMFDTIENATAFFNQLRIPCYVGNLDINDCNCTDEYLRYCDTENEDDCYGYDICDSCLETRIKKISSYFVIFGVPNSVNLAYNAIA